VQPGQPNEIDQPAIQRLLPERPEGQVEPTNDLGRKIPILIGQDANGDRVAPVLSLPAMREGGRDAVEPGAGCRATKGTDLQRRRAALDRLAGSPSVTSGWASSARS
jgi:hypothetical protein